MLAIKLGGIVSPKQNGSNRPLMKLTGVRVDRKTVNKPCVQTCFLAGTIKNAAHKSSLKLTALGGKGNFTVVVGNSVKTRRFNIICVVKVGA